MIEDDDDIQDYKKPWVGLTDDSMEDMLKQNIVGLLNGREVTLGRYPNPPHRIGWVWKDTGLPPTEEEVIVKRKEKNNA